MRGNRTVGDVLLEMECDNRRMLRSLINIKMEASKITGNPTSTNCPNCGAPIAGPICEYCETVFDISETKKILAFKENERIYKKAMDAMLEYTPD